MAGIDEAGRGPLAGPVVAAAVVLSPDQPIDGLTDSKKISEKSEKHYLISSWQKPTQSVWVNARMQKLID